jgi:hypothetical protein
MSLLTFLEVMLWIVVGVVFWSKKLHTRFPALHRYLLLRVIATPTLMVVLQLQAHFNANIWFPVYFFGFWAVYIASAIMLLFVCIELFRTALSGFTGLMRFGTVIFRWAVVLSVISCMATISFHHGILLIPDVAIGLMRAVSIIELGLLAFVCLAMNALQLSYRSLCFGFALGFGVLSTSDFVCANLFPRWTNFQAASQFVSEFITLAVLAFWTAYIWQPEPARKPIVVASDSTLYRWNEIASALGHKGTNVVTVPQGATASFFLTDVEKVVDKVLTRQLKEGA